MTLKMCYDKFGGGYEDVKERFLTDERVAKFLLMFLDDPSFLRLSQALEENDLKKAFIEAYTLTGVCFNLGFVKMSKSSGNLAEALKNGSGDNKRLFSEVKSDYETTIKAINEWKDQK